MPSFHGRPGGIVGQAAIPSTDRRTRLPNIDERRPRDPDVRAGQRGHHPGFLAPGHEVVDQHAEASVGRRAVSPEDAGEVVEAVQALDDDTLDPKVVAPHLLHQFGVVDALDQQAARTGDPRPATRNGNRTRGSPGVAACAPGLGPSAGLRTQGHGGSPEEKGPRAQRRKVPFDAGATGPQDDARRVEPHNRAGKTGAEVGDDHAGDTPCTSLVAPPPPELVQSAQKRCRAPRGQPSGQR